MLGLGITAIAHYLVNGLGIDVLPNSLVPEDIDIPIYILVVPYAIMLFFLGGGQEEFGWRGYVQEPMQRIFGIIKGSLIIGLLWSLWHGPLWLMAGEGHAYYSFIAFIIYTTSWSLVIGIVYNLCGKKMIIPWAMHTIANLSVSLFPVIFLEDVPQPGYWVWTLLNLLVAIALGLWFVFVKNKGVNADKLEKGDFRQVID